MMEKKRPLLALMGGLAAVTLLAGCAGGSGSDEPAPTTGNSNGDDFDWSSVDPVELTVSSIFGPGSTATNLLENWMEAVTEQTEGAVTFDYYQNGTLHPATEALEAMTSALTDVTFVSTGYFPDQLPISNWDDVVVQRALADFGYPNTNIAGIGQQVIHYEGDSVAAAEMREAGFMPILPMLSGPAALTCAEEFDTAEDLEGRQVRIANAVAQGEMEALGMVGIFTASNEQYEALQRGVLDCAVNAPTQVLSWDLLAVAPWVTMMNTAPTSGSLWAISTGSWDELIPEIQQVMLDARYEALEGFASQTLEEYKEMPAAAESAGGGIIDPAALNPLIQQWWAAQQDPAENAPAGVDDPEASIALTNSVADAWWDFSVDTLEVPVGDTVDMLEVLNLGSGAVKDWDQWTAALEEGLGRK